MAVYNLISEKILFQKICDGDEIAFRQLFNTYKNRVFTFVNNVLHSKADAEEIVQETFLVLWLNKHTLINIEHPRNYIYTIARNKTYDSLAKISRNEKLLEQNWANISVGLNDIEQSIAFKESRDTIEKSLKSLSLQKQQIFNLSRKQHKSHEEIAELMGLSKSRVKNVIVEVLKHIKYSLGKNDNVYFFVVFNVLIKKYLE